MDGPVGAYANVGKHTTSKIMASSHTPKQVRVHTQTSVQAVLGVRFGQVPPTHQHIAASQNRRSSEAARSTRSASATGRPS